MWSENRTYIPIREGFMYLAATLDWYSRCVVSWKLSNSLEMLAIFKTDQGVQFTSKTRNGAVERAGIRVRMDSKRKCFVNIFAEKLGRTYEDCT